MIILLSEIIIIIREIDQLFKTKNKTRLSISLSLETKFHFLCFKKVAKIFGSFYPERKKNVWENIVKIEHWIRE